MTKVYQRGHKHSPGVGGIKCPCCTKDTPGGVKRGTNRAIRREGKKAVRDAE